MSSGAGFAGEAGPRPTAFEPPETGEDASHVAGSGPSSTEPSSPEPSGTGPSGTGPPAPGRTGKRRRTVLWATVGVAVLVAVLIAVIASAQPSSQVSAKSPLLGDAAPAISGPGLAGGHYSLAQFRNEWVLVNFMATWCQPCQQEMPQLLEFAKQHAKTADATVLTVVYDPTNVSQLKTFLAVRGARWPAVDDPSASVSYGVTGLPSSFLVAPDGVVYAYVPGEVRAAALNSWLRQGAAKGLGPA